MPERKSYRHDLQLRKRYGARKEMSVRYRTLSDHTDLHLWRRGLALFMWLLLPMYLQDTSLAGE